LPGALTDGPLGKKPDTTVIKETGLRKTPILLESTIILYGRERDP
jgi:hypothetical protein